MIELKNPEVYGALGEEFENEELFALSHFGTFEDLTEDNVLNQLEHLHQKNFDCSNEIEFIFTRLIFRDLRSLNNQLLREFFRRRSLLSRARFGFTNDLAIC
jgi:hypothetical protein